MILLKLKHFFKEHQEATTLEVAKHYKIQPSAAQGMIDFWVQKGRLTTCDNVCSKTSCAGCSVNNIRYRWCSAVST